MLIGLRDVLSVSCPAGMVKNKGKGGKNRRRGKADGDMKRELTFKEDGQEYAQVTRMLGNGRLEAFCFDGVNRLCHIRGKLRKRVWIGVGDIILLGLREFQDQKADIILKYDGDEARSLKTYGELPDTVQINAGAEMLDGEEFGDDSMPHAASLNASPGAQCAVPASDLYSSLCPAESWQLALTRVIPSAALFACSQTLTSMRMPTGRTRTETL